MNSTIIENEKIISDLRIMKHGTQIRIAKILNDFVKQTGVDIMAVNIDFSAVGDTILVDLDVSFDDMPGKIEQFKKTNQPCSAMTFGHAIEALKAGKKVARQGWNGKGMFIYLTEGTEVNKDILRGACAEAIKYVDSKMSLASLPSQHTQKICSHIDMKAADGSIVVGWLASQTDTLAEDWIIL